MKKEKKLSVRLGLLAGLVSLALLGSTAGSLAWYAYSRTVLMSFVGTTVASSALLNVGLVDNEGVFTPEKVSEFKLERENNVVDGDETNSIVWCKSRSGFSLEALSYYLEESGYAFNYLKPVTTGSRVYNDSSELTLFRAPEYSETSINNRAPSDHYVYLPFAFRVIDETSEYVAGKNIWITEAVCTATQNAESTIRVFVDGVSPFLMKPADESADIGETKVGGVLSLNPGEYYDFDPSTMREYCYGEFEDRDAITYSAKEASEYDVLDDMNDVEDDSIATTFNGKHYPGTLVPNLDAGTPLVQEHAGFGKVKPSVSSTGQLYTENGNGIPVALTSNESKVGYAKLTVFVEGWDHSVIDQKAGYSFNLGLKFEIDRI